MNKPAAGFRDAVRSGWRWLSRWRHPFWWLPDVPAEQDRAYQRIWADLRQATDVRDGRHDTRDWYAREGAFICLSVPVPPYAFSSSYPHLMQALESFDFVRPVPLENIQISVQEIGYLSAESFRRDEITHEWLDEFITQVEPAIREFRPFTVQFGGANSYIDSAFIDVDDGGWLSRIHTRVVDFVSQPPRTRFAYLPEVVIAEYNGEGKVSTLVPALTPFRDVSLGGFTVQHIDIVALDTTEAWPTPRLLHRISLGYVPPLVDRVNPS